MYYYKFESIDFEEQHAFELTHTRKFSRKDLDVMVSEAIRIYIERDYDADCIYAPPCHIDIGNLFFDGSLQDTLVREFGFEKIDYESTIGYGGEALFGDDFRHRRGVDFRKILSDVKVPRCTSCDKDECLIENERF